MIKINNNMQEICLISKIMSSFSLVIHFSLPPKKYKQLLTQIFTLFTD